MCWPSVAVAYRMPCSYGRVPEFREPFLTCTTSTEDGETGKKTFFLCCAIEHLYILFENLIVFMFAVIVD